MRRWTKITVRLSPADVARLDSLREPGESRTAAAHRLLKQALGGVDVAEAVVERLRPELEAIVQRLTSLQLPGTPNEGPIAEGPTAEELGIAGLLDRFEDAGAE